MKRVYKIDKLGEELASKLVLGITVPRPIGWISTLSKEGIKNLAPFSFFNAVCDFPPVFLISAGEKDGGYLKDTVKNILDTKEFTINFVTEDTLKKMKVTGEEFPPNVDEFKEAGLTPQNGINIKAPLVEESPINIECKLYDYKRIYDMHIIFGEAISFIIKEDIINESFRIDYSKLKIIGRLAGSLYVKAFGDCILDLK